MYYALTSGELGAINMLAWNSDHKVVLIELLEMKRIAIKIRDHTVNAG